MKISTMSCAVVALVAGAAVAQTEVTGGQTSVLLDTATLSAAASLDLSGVSADVIAPGNLGDGSVAFGINARDAGSLPTTFSYDSGDFFGTFGGTIEHSGSVFFNAGTVEVGNFTIGFDAGRVGDNRSGFFVESTTGIAAILFDVAAPSQLDVFDSSLTIGADLLVSAEFAGFLFDNGLASSDLKGADVGDALVQAMPTPGGVAALGLAGLVAARRRR
jgi:MYXO-CTERM domain-containing protein